MGRRGRHEFGSPTRSSAVAQRSDHGCIPPTSTAHPATMADHEELGCNTATKYAFDAPLFVLARSSDATRIAMLLLAWVFCRCCVGMRGPSSACGVRRFQRVQMWCAGCPAAQAGRLQDARVRRGSCERPQSFCQNKSLTQNRSGGGARGLFFFIFLTLLF